MTRPPLEPRSRFAYSPFGTNGNREGFTTSRGSPAPLTTTSFAILGLLAIKPWTTYELAAQMDRGLGRFWPRARSKLFEEPKKLVAHGLARAKREKSGRRARTSYSITPAGRRALAAWLGESSAPPTLEFEGFVKVFFAEHGSKSDLVRTLESMIDWAASRREVNLERARSYLGGTGPFQERAAILALTGQFLWDFDVLVGSWARWALHEVERWPDEIADAEPARIVWRRILREEVP